MNEAKQDSAPTGSGVEQSPKGRSTFTSEPRTTDRTPRLSPEQYAREVFYSASRRLKELSRIPNPSPDQIKELTDLEVRDIWRRSLDPDLAPEVRLTEKARREELNKILVQPGMRDYLLEEIVVGPNERMTRLAIQREDISKLLGLAFPQRRR